MPVNELIQKPCEFKSKDGIARTDSMPRSKKLLSGQGARPVQGPGPGYVRVSFTRTPVKAAATAGWAVRSRGGVSPSMQARVADPGL